MDVVCVLPDLSKGVVERGGYLSALLASSLAYGSLPCSTDSDVVAHYN